MKRQWMLLAMLVVSALLLSGGESVVLAEGPPTPERPLEMEDTALEELAADLLRCTDIEREQYCFGVGFTDLKPGSPEWQRWLSVALAQEDSDTGDMSLATYLQIRARLSSAELRELEREEFIRAHAAVGSVKLGNYLGKREPIPAGFFERYPLLDIAEGSPQAAALRKAARTGEPLDLSAFYMPTDAEIQEEVRLLGTFQPGALPTQQAYSSSPYYRHIIPHYYREQIKSYYCGPATMETFADAAGSLRDQYYWADKLGTEALGYTSIWSLIPTINDYTNWSASYHGGPYAVVSVNGPGKDINWFVAQHEIRIGIYAAPIVEHVLLHTNYFDYLRYNHGGHYQTGRGYSHINGTISIFEPYDEQKWSSGGYHTGKPQSVSFYDMWRATYDHPQQNFGR